MSFNTALTQALKNSNNGIVKLLIKQEGIEISRQDMKYLNKFYKEDEKELKNISQSNDTNINCIPGHCTFEQTGYKYVMHRTFFYCRTCSMDQSKSSICEECAKICHKGHDVIEATHVTPCFCDCGAGHGIYPCKLMKKMKKK